MPYKISELKAKWNKEKDYYRNQELGSGVHSFIRACLESNELFGLIGMSRSLHEEMENFKNDMAEMHMTKKVKNPQRFQKKVE